MKLTTNNLFSGEKSIYDSGVDDASKLFLNTIQQQAGPSRSPDHGKTFLEFVT